MSEKPLYGMFPRVCKKKKGRFHSVRLSIVGNN